MMATLSHERAAAGHGPFPDSDRAGGYVSFESKVFWDL